MRGSRALGAAFVVAFTALVVACVPAPVRTPDDPAIPGQSTPAFPNLTNPPSSAGPSVPPVPTTAPGTFAYGDTVTIHTSMGSTWEITPIENVDPADSLMASNGSTPAAGTRFVILEVTIKNVGVVLTHPFYDTTFAYQPANAPMYDQNTSARAAAPQDIGYEYDIPVGATLSGQVVVAVPENAPDGVWMISGDEGDTFYRFE